MSTLAFAPDPDTCEALPASIKHGADITDIQRTALASEGYVLAFTSEGMYWCRPESTFHPETRRLNAQANKRTREEYAIKRLALADSIRAWRVREIQTETAGSLCSAARALTGTDNYACALAEVMDRHETELIEHLLATWDAQIAKEALERVK